MTHAQPKSKWKSLMGGLLLASTLGTALLPIPNAMYAQAADPETGAEFEAQTATADCSAESGFSSLLCNLKTLVVYFTTPSLVWRGMLEAVFGFISGIVTEIFRGVAFATNSIIIGLMNMPVSPSHPEAPSAIKEGWKISRDLVNLLFLTLLVFIGLATILDLPGYAYKQSLPLFLVMVLLINFSGLLVGLMADIGNIVANFFLQKTQEVGWTSMQFSTPADLASKGGWAIVTTHLAEIVYYFAAIFVFYALLLVFFIRTFVLWTLAIVAPFAFASYILPSTRGMIWNRWWKELIQWSIIGVPISFFMYLSALVLDRADIGSVGLSWAANMMGPFTSLFLLFAGIAIAMEFVPKGAAGAVAHAQGLGKKTALWAKTRATIKARERLVQSPRINRAADWLAQRKTWGAGQSGIGGWAKRQVSAPFATAARAMGATVGTQLRATHTKLVDQTQKDNLGKDVTALKKAFNDAGSAAERLGVLLAAIQNGNVDGLLEGPGAVTAQEATRLMPFAGTVGKQREVMMAMPTDALINNMPTGPGQPAVTAAYIGERISPENFGKTANRIISHYRSTDPLVRGAAYDIMGGVVTRGKNAHLSEFVKQARGQEGADALEDFLDEYLLRNPVPVPAGATTQAQARFYALQAINPRMATWVTNNPGAIGADIRP